MSTEILPTVPPACLTTRVELAELQLLRASLPLVRPFRSAVGERHAREALFVRWVTPAGDWGIGECSCRPDPFFSGEYVAGAMQVLAEFAFPLLPTRGTYAEIAAALERVRGWPFAISAVLDAAGDLLRRRGQPDPWSDWPGAALERVPVGISLGLFDTAEAAVDAVREAVREHYCRVKLKVTPRGELETLRAVRAEFPDLHLGFDANGSCGEADLPFLRELAALEPAMIEQPFAPDRLDLHASLRRELPGLRVCLDESLRGVGDARTAHALGALDEVNVKPGRLGGPLRTRELLAWCAAEEIPAWVGGMFETGVGRRANLRVAARLPAATGHDLSPSRRYFAEDVILDPPEMGADGHVALMGERPVELSEFFERCITERVSLTAESH